MRPALLGLLLVTVAYAAAPPWPAKSRWPVGRSVTFVDGPLDADGYVDFPAALNARLSHGVTPENNAAVLLWRAIGPRPEGKAMPPEYFRLLGTAPPPEAGDYFIDARRYARERLKLDDEAAGRFRKETAACRQAWAAKDRPDVAGWLKANEKPLAVIVEATRRPRCFLPLLPDLHEGKSVGLLTATPAAAQASRDAAAALTWLALLRAAEGDAAGAWDALLACHRLARLMAHGRGLFDPLVGVAIEALACDADLAFLEHARPDAAALAGYDRDLRALPPMPRTDDRAERLIFLDMLQVLARHGPRHLGAGGGGPVTPDAPFLRLFESKVDYVPAMRVGNEWFDKLAATGRVATRRERMERLEAFRRQVNLLYVSMEEPRAKLASWFGGPEARGREAGKRLVWLLMPALLQVRKGESRAGQVHDNLLLAVALERHRRDHGCYPKDLSALAPKYVKAVPDDRFSGGPLVYRPDAKGYILSSVGENGKDDGGRGKADDPPADDLVVRVPRRR